MYENDTREQFIRLRAMGKSVRIIAKVMNIAKNTVWRWNTEYADEIAAKRQCIIDLALGEQGLGKLDRLKIAGDLLLLLKDRLLNETKDSAAPDKATMESFVKLYKLIGNEDTFSPREIGKKKLPWVPVQIDMSSDDVPEWARIPRNRPSNTEPAP
ncbi:MAG: hypothetical protein ACHQQQ_09680 [Bacteroidota bacterium]